MKPTSDGPSDHPVDATSALDTVSSQRHDRSPVEFEGYELDPILTSSLREARWILWLWLGCFVWTLSVCLSLGYPKTVDPDRFPTVLGLPAWVAWGIVFPWLISNALTIWFCLFRMADGDLGEEPEGDSFDSGGAFVETDHRHPAMKGGDDE